MTELVNDSLVTKGKNNFNLLRLLAALGVIITHAYALLGLPERDFVAIVTHGLLSFSRLGVYVFFVISGFLIAYSLSHSSSILNFFWKRLLRIFPALIVVLILTVFVVGPTITKAPLKTYFTQLGTYHYLLGGISLYDTQHQLLGVFTDNPHPGVNGSLWTLPYEWTCYVLLACSLWFIKKRRAWVLGALILVSIALRVLIGHYQIGLVIDFLHLDSRQFLLFNTLFLLGALALEMRHTIKFRWIGATVLAVGLVILSFYYKKLSFYWMLVAVPYITIWLASLPLTNRLGRWFNDQDFSYGFYIYAFPVSQILVAYFKNNLSVLTLAVFTTLLTFPLAFLSWHFIERPCLKFKKG